MTNAQQDDKTMTVVAPADGGERSIERNAYSRASPAAYAHTEVSVERPVSGQRTLKIKGT